MDGWTRARACVYVYVRMSACVSVFIRVQFFELRSAKSMCDKFIQTLKSLCVCARARVWVCARVRVCARTRVSGVSGAVQRLEQVLRPDDTRSETGGCI